MLRLRRGLTIANKSFESNRIRNIPSSSSKLLDCIRTIPQIRRKPKHELNGERIQRVLELLRFVIFHCVKNRRNRYLLSDLYRFTGRKSLIVMIVYKMPNLRKPINYFIENMAFSDILAAIFWMPLNLSLVHTNSLLIGGQLGQALCTLVFFVGNVSLFVSIQNLILIAVDRFGAVVFPLRSPFIRSKLSPFFILATRIVAVAISSIFDRQRYRRIPRENPVCYEMGESIGRIIVLCRYRTSLLHSAYKPPSALVSYCLLHHHYEAQDTGTPR